MNYKLFIAIRYLFSKKRHNTINLITWVSMVGVAIGTTALIVVLSVLNGFENMVQDSFSAFDPSLKILPQERKSFSTEDSLIIKAKNFLTQLYILWNIVICINNNRTPVLFLKTLFGNPFIPCILFIQSF